ncbi:hypothetical protein TOPH_00717 [Tolypocladium ophioglossoides CBS 100239]|uniref:Uncharacterized protein n=1 Tax=Tolypocladium ophioglossoides (strain CBS 100239) TaxID=1163406 RepID=A0A0L0NKY0_TOLOC|nr:hypothetical protein TOPH_00717 [Tolypocladium ophioglossoides CBS 100239]
MSENRYLVEEIIMIASCVLCLVVLLGCLIMYNANSELPRREQGNTAIRGTWDRGDAAQAAGSYCDETFIDNVRRRSVALAEDLKRELWSLKRKGSLSGSMLDPRMADPGVGVSLQNFTMGTTGGTIRRSQPDSDGDRPVWPGVSSSLTLNTQRVEALNAERRHTSCMQSDGGSCDLETQDSDDWLS